MNDSSCSMSLRNRQSATSIHNYKLPVTYYLFTYFYIQGNKMLNQPIRPVGIAGYGAYVPRYRLPGSEISRVWSESNSKSPVREKAVPGLDEDTATMSIEAAR